MSHLLFDSFLTEFITRLLVWNPITKETLSPNDYNAPYILSKTAGERAVWEWAKVHPHVSVTTSEHFFLSMKLHLQPQNVVLPPVLYGPLPPVGVHPAPGDFNAFTTSICVYNLISPTGTFPALPVHADVRDVADAHIRALSTAFSSKAKSQRLIVGSPHGIIFKDVVELIRRERPELNDRLITAPAPELPFDRLGLDFGRVEESIGMKKEDFHTIDQVCFYFACLLRLETDSLLSAIDYLRHGRLPDQDGS